ncbi:MAG: thioredoxin family protein [Gammaproteobacteria bacterium]|nr:thioredoxin family protein [Gammaproteobacteria bacterium]
MKSLVKYTLLFILAAGIWPAAHAADARDAYKYFFNDSFGDFKEELQNARAQGKKGIMVFFEMDECPFCHYMKENVFSQAEVQAYFRANFLLLAVDIEGDVEMVDFNGEHIKQKDFAARHRVRATPVIGFFDLDGNKTTRYTGRTADANEFMLLGKYVLDEHYKTMPFVNFKRDTRWATAP